VIGQALQGKEIDTDAPSSAVLSESLTQQGDHFVGVVLGRDTTGPSFHARGVLAYQIRVNWLASDLLRGSEYPAFLVY